MAVVGEQASYIDEQHGMQGERDFVRSFPCYDCGACVLCAECCAPYESHSVTVALCCVHHDLIHDVIAFATMPCAPSQVPGAAAAISGPEEKQQWLLCLGLITVLFLTLINCVGEASCGLGFASRPRRHRTKQSKVQGSGFSSFVTQL